MTMNINRVFKLVDTCAAEFKAKHLITTDIWSRNRKANGERYVDNESIVTDKKNNCSWVRPK
jgi:carbamoyl-phosphate synthase large subunit